MCKHGHTFKKQLPSQISHSTCLHSTSPSRSCSMLFHLTVPFLLNALMYLLYIWSSFSFSFLPLCFTKTNGWTWTSERWTHCTKVQSVFPPLALTTHRKFNLSFLSVTEDKIKMEIQPTDKNCMILKMNCIMNRPE